MSESSRDRVARVLYDVRDDEFDTDEWEDLDSQQRERWYCYADALIAAGLVSEGGETPSTAFEVMAAGHGLPIMLRHGAHDNPLRVRSWTHDGGRFLVEYVEVTS